MPVAGGTVMAVLGPLTPGTCPAESTTPSAAGRAQLSQIASNIFGYLHVNFIPVK